MRIQSLTLDTKRRRAANLTPWPLYPAKELRKGGSWAGLNVWVRKKSLSLARVRTTNLSARILCYTATGNQSLNFEIPICLTAPHNALFCYRFFFNKGRELGNAAFQQAHFPRLMPLLNWWKDESCIYLKGLWCSDCVITRHIRYQHQNRTIILYTE